MGLFVERVNWYNINILILIEDKDMHLYKQQIVCLIIMLFISAFFFASDRKADTAKRYGALLKVSIFQLICDIVSVYTVNHLETVPAFVNRIVHVFYMGFMLYLFVVMYRYLIALIEEGRGEAVPKVKWLYVPFIIGVVGLCVLPIEYIETAKGNYSYGYPIFLVYGCIVVYIALLARKLYAYRENIPEKKRKTVIIVVLSEIPIVVYQIIVPTSLISCLAITMIVLGLYMTVENADARLVKLLEKETKRADIANQAKTNFLANMSHEIRTPINAVLGMNEMILRECEDDTILEYSRDIQGAAKSLLGIINDILDITKIEAGKLRIVDVEYDLLKVMRDIENMISFKAKSKNLNFVINIDENIPGRFLGDDIRVRQVLVNILNNAVKYTHEGMVELNARLILIKEEENTAEIYFSIKDTGIGIKQEDIEKLFIPFERIEEKRNRNIEGTGLGMNITMQLLNLLGSKLNVSSEYGKGSEFSFILKQKIADREPVGNYFEKKAKTEATKANTSAGEKQFNLEKAKVLVVDDNEINRKVFRSLLKRTKIQVDDVNSGRECLKKVQENYYDIVFMDHMMPEMDGIETLHEMKKLQECPCKDVPIVILTANAIVGAKEKYLKEGFNAYLSKPIDADELEKLIVELLDESKVQLVTISEKTEKADKKIDKSDLPFVEGLDWDYAIVHFKDKESLLDTVKAFVASMEHEAKELKKCYEDINSFDKNISEAAMKNYRIKVHSMKNSAALIGIVPMAGMAKILEDAAKIMDSDTIKLLTPVFLEKWLQYKEHLKGFEDKSEATMMASEHMSDIEAIFEIIRKAAADMDIDVLDEQLAELKRYNFEGEKKELFESIQSAIINIDVDYLENI